MTSAQKRKLLEYFRRNGYCRVPDPKLRRKHSRTYKKGYEVRLVAFSKRELQEIRQLLRAAGIPPGAPHRKVNRWIQPVYGKEATAAFMQLFRTKRRLSAKRNH
jgi:hypothetical protein